jgi:hypothetical protein
MFFLVLVVTFVLALLTSFVVERSMRASVSKILSRVVGDIADAWQKYVSLGIYVMGISWGAPVGRLQYYLDPRSNSEPLVLDAPHMILEGYRTVVDTMYGVVTLLLVFFVVTMIAYVIVRGQESRAERKVA